MTHQTGPVQVAYTVGDHALQGVRVWGVLPEGENGLMVYTTAFERPRGTANSFMHVPGHLAATAIWTIYLLNIGENHFGGGGYISVMPPTPVPSMQQPFGALMPD